MRSIRVTVAVIDNSELEARRVGSLIDEAAGDAVGLYWLDAANPLELSVASVFPAAGESSGDFLARISDSFACRESRASSLFSQVKVAVLAQRFGSDPLSSGGRLTGHAIADAIRRFRPDVNCYLLGEEAAPSAEIKADRRICQTFPKGQLLHERGRLSFLQAVISEIRRRYDTPFWGALKEFASKPKAVFHAAAGLDVTSGAGSPAFEELIEYYGKECFRAEGSATNYPLDSLLSPKGSLKDAQAKFAACFGADSALFVTGGTTTANKIVHSAFCTADDVVLLDQSSHISHHYALALTGAIPIFLRPYATQVPGIGGAVPLNTLREAFRAALSFTRRRPFGRRVPRLIALTNCTFDGIIFNPKSVIEAVVEELTDAGLRDHLKDIIFLFDEAWFSFARFHPGFIGSTAAHATAQLRCDAVYADYYTANLRVYVTQSIHKMAFAFRQASVVLCLDPALSDSASTKGAAQRRALNQSYLCYSTTSPNLGMLGSLDVARRAMDLEGCALVAEALLHASCFKDSVSALRRESSRLHIARKHELIASEHATEFRLDPTKLTLRTNLTMSGKDLRDMLWRDHGVQVNRFSADSVLCMFMPGVQTEQVTRLIRATRLVSTHLAGRGRSVEYPGLDELIPSWAKRVFASETGPADIAKVLDGSRRFPLRRFVFDVQHLTPIDYELDPALIGSDSDVPELIVSANFITPYPPGYPIAIPGEILDRKRLLALTKFEHGEMHGVTLKGGRQTIQVYMIPARSVRAVNTDHTAKPRLTELPLET